MNSIKTCSTRTGVAQHRWLLAVLLLVVLPLSLDIFRLNLVGKYLTYAFVAVGLVMCGATAACSASARACSSAWAATAWRCS